MNNRNKKLVAGMLLSCLVTPLAPVLAQDYLGTIGAIGIGAGMMTQGGAPSQEAIKKMMEGVQAQAQAAADASKEQLKEMPPLPALPPMIVGMPAFDMSKFPKPPMMPNGGPRPEFMGKPLAGEGSNPMMGQIGMAFEKIQDGLIQAEDGVKQMKEGQIKTDSIDGTMKEARKLYDAAQAAFAAGDNQKAAQLLQQIQALNLQGKFGQFEQKAISADLIGDVKKQLNDANATLSKAPADGEVDEAKAKIQAALEKISQAEALLKKGDKQGAAKIMKQLRDENPSGEAGLAQGQFKGLNPKKMGEILNTIKEGLGRAERGLAKAKENGIVVEEASLTLLKQGVALYGLAQTAYDNEDYVGAAQKLLELRKLGLEEHFSAFKEKALPLERLQSFMEQLNRGVKALKLTIEHAKTFGISTVELEGMLVQLTNIQVKAKAALDSKDREAFLTLMDQADSLKVNDRVNEIIRKLAGERAKPLVEQGITKLEAVVVDLTALANGLAKGKPGDARADQLLSVINKNFAAAKEAFAKADYMAAGKLLDDVTGDVLALSNVLRDAGMKMGADQLVKIKQASDSAFTSEGLISSDDGKLQGLMSKVGRDDGFLVKNSLMQLNPELLDEVIGQRSKDQKFIESVMRDVLPLIPERDRQKTLEGKLGLLAESQAAERTIEQLKKIKGVPADAIAMINQFKEQIKSFNFPPAIASSLEERLSDFNNKIQSGEVKDPREIFQYAKLMKEEIGRNMTRAQQEKFKQGLVPGKNIEDTNPLFTDLKYLKDDGAIKANAKGEIDIKQKVDKKMFANMINNTIDQKAMTASGGNLTLGDAVKAAAQAYGMANSPDMVQKLGLPFKPADLKKPLVLGDASQLVAHADQRWGMQ